MAPHKPALGGDEVADRIDVDEGLKPAGCCLGSHEDTAGQPQGEKHDGADAHDSLGCAHQQADGGPYPGQAERKDQQEADPGRYPRSRPGQAKSNGDPEYDDQARASR